MELKCYQRKTIMNGRSSVAARQSRGARGRQADGQRRALPPAWNRWAEHLAEPNRSGMLRRRGKRCLQGYHCATAGSVSRKK